jgi:hypothetical protein
MGEKANFDSVTTEGCSCTYMQREAAEPSSPIQFNTEMQEYQFAHLSGGGHSMIYHCPWCGGVAPRSQRERHFAVLTWEEIRRLEGITRNIRSPQEAVSVFGEPDEERDRGVTVQLPPTDTMPERTESYRTLTFKGLSSTADVCLVDYGVQGVKWQYSPKYIGRPEGEV